MLGKTIVSGQAGSVGTFKFGDKAFYFGVAGVRRHDADLTLQHLQSLKDCERDDSWPGFE